MLLALIASFQHHRLQNEPSIFETKFCPSLYIPGAIARTRFRLSCRFRIWEEESACQQYRCANGLPNQVSLDSCQFIYSKLKNYESAVGYLVVFRPAVDGINTQNHATDNCCCFKNANSYKICVHIALFRLVKLPLSFLTLLSVKNCPGGWHIACHYGKTCHNDN